MIALIAFTNTILNSQNFNGDIKNNTLFELKKSSSTGISFNNAIEDTPEANVLIYEAFYNGGGVAIGDFNNDGLPDIYFAGNQVEDKLYLNLGDFKFKDITKSAGILNRGGWSTGVSIVDINGDGYKDIYVCKSLYDDKPHLRINELYINNGDLTFTESAASYRVNDPWRSMHANFFDYDKDGDFDLFLINQAPNPSMLSNLKGKNWLDPKLTYRFLKNSNGIFEEVTKTSGLENVGYGLSAVTADFNNDGWPDLYVANDYEGPDFLYINNQDGTFTNKINEYLSHISFFSMGTDVGDINNDGLLDLAVVDMVAEDNFRIKSNMSGMNPQEFWNIVNLNGHYQYMYNTIQLNRGLTKTNDLLFSDVGQIMGASSTDWSWSPIFADFDNNGFKDLFVTNGIKRDVRNTDALKKIDEYLNELSEKHPSKNLVNNVPELKKVVSIEKMLGFFPAQKLPNYTFKNNGDLKFEKASKSWGLNQNSFSSGAAYGDLDNDGDLDLVVNNVDDMAFVYENNSNKISKNNYLNIKFKEGNKHKSFFGTRATVYYNGNQQVSELTSARGFYSSSEDIIHFGLGAVKKVDSLVIKWYNGDRSVINKIKTNQTLVLDRADLKSLPDLITKAPTNTIFEDVTEALNMSHYHKENIFDDYEREVLLPHKMSVLGPSLAVGDINNDGREDFFVGGSVGENGSFFTQNESGKFSPLSDEFYKSYVYHEDMGACLFDADLDGDLDLYVSSGGNEYDAGNGLYQDRLYLNDGSGKFTLTKNVLPELRASGGKVIQVDYDSDGDIDLFVCGRQVPGKYPEPAESYLLKNKLKETGTLNFEKIVNDDFKKLGMVTDANWTDYDNDNDLDLIVVGEWMPVTIFQNNKGQFKNINSNLSGTTGWWYSIASADIDNDGDEDYIIGNLGLNYKYKASIDEPFTVNYGDFDQNGKNDIVLGYYNYGEHYPLRGRSCSSQQIPDLKKKFKSYNEFAGASLVDVYSSDLLNQSLEYKANTFSSICLENLGNGKFKIHELPRMAQLSSINGIVIDDVDNDGKKDVIIAGNMYGSEVETPRNDASVGLFLKGNGDCTFNEVAMQESGLSLPYDVKKLKTIHINGKKHLIVGINDGPIKIIKYE
ncbi:VCBS repeat-containing protein [Hwangdonia lutea]|uniref:VCBS repeat-containing protein n=1 Tax=Hwangdonia lutea TaxID=3075823 RepID=A0AA97HRV6_9FLAO|nr:VCBS repeat-containing protein [Hwangdonia sp. SCSIO 19198]WOD43893.1 VCBS repeat-containing protein [Hwangdonia sp. SCSIO 19198]